MPCIGIENFPMLNKYDLTLPGTHRITESKDYQLTSIGKHSYMEWCYNSGKIVRNIRLCR